MATVTTVTPSTTVRQHRPSVADSGATLSGKIDLATREGWTYLSSFVVSGLGLTYNSGGPSVDIAQGRVARAQPDGAGQQLATIGAVTGVSLASSAVNYIYYRDDDVYEVRDTDNPPSPDALLIGTVDTGAATVTEAVRGRSPVSQFAAVGSSSSGGSTTTSGGGGVYTPEGGTLQARITPSALTGVGEVAAPAVDVNDDSVLYIKDSTNGQYASLDVSSPSSPSVLDTVASPVALDTDLPLTPHPDGSTIYDAGPEVAISLSSPGQFSSATDTGTFSGGGCAAIGDTLYASFSGENINTLDISNRTSPSFVRNRDVGLSETSAFAALGIGPSGLLWAKDQRSPDWVAFDPDPANQDLFSLGPGAPPLEILIGAHVRNAYSAAGDRLFVSENAGTALAVVDIDEGSRGSGSEEFFRQPSLNSHRETDISTRYQDPSDMTAIVDGDRDVVFTFGPKSSNSAELRFDAYDATNLSHISGLTTTLGTSFNIDARPFNGFDRAVCSTSSGIVTLNISDETAISQIDTANMSFTTQLTTLTVDSGTRYVFGKDRGGDQIGFAELNGSQIVNTGFSGSVYPLGTSGTGGSIFSDDTRFYIALGGSMGYAVFDPSDNNWNLPDDSFVGMTSNVPNDILNIEQGGFTDDRNGITAFISFGPTLNVSEHS